MIDISIFLWLKINKDHWGLQAEVPLPQIPAEPPRPFLSLSEPGLEINGFLGKNHGKNMKK